MMRKGSKSDTSLNDCLHVGPSLNPYSILIRFRENKEALVADIEKAFLNVKVNKEGRLQILSCSFRIELFIISTKCNFNAQYLKA